MATVAASLMSVFVVGVARGPRSRVLVVTWCFPAVHGITTLTMHVCLPIIRGKGLSGHILSVVERFDPSTGWWQNVPSMHSPRSAFSAGAVGGKIFAAGGFNGVEGIDMVECFDQDVGVWETQPQMSTSRIGGTAVVAAGEFPFFCFAHLV